MKHGLSLGILAVTILFGNAISAHAQDLNAAYEKATKVAVAKVSPSVVQIVTQGGTDLVVTGPKGPAFRKALGPTTGVIVSPDGYIISSAFNFVNDPKTILVEIPGRKDRFIAKRIATDRSRMLTLLKIDAKDLPTPEWKKENEIAVGEWAIALGRTLDDNQDNPPAITVGVISALNRVWGKCLQTDANTSPINYGGPLVDIQGCVQGIIVPASPRGTDETAGFEWYDSGIGFAVPMQHVMEVVVEKLKKGKDLNRGLLGVQMSSQDIYSVQPTVAVVTSKSAAEKAGLKKGDTIVELEGHPIVRMAQIMHILGPKYEGDTVSLKYKRGKDVIAIKDLELVGTSTSQINSYLGLLPMRDDPALGVEIRHVFADSPAAKAGLKPGDRVTKYGIQGKLKGFAGKIRGSEELRSFLHNISPGTTIDIEVKRKEGKTEKVSVQLAEFPGTSKDNEYSLEKELPEIASFKKALEPLEQPGKKGGKKAPEEKEVKTGLLKKTTANGNSSYWVYVHEDYDPNVSHAVMVWLHPPGQNTEKDMQTFIKVWEPICASQNILLVTPITNSVDGWVPSDARSVQEVIRDIIANYSVDEQRIATHGMAVGGQMAIYLGMNNRELIRGVATTGAVPNGIKDNVIASPVSFFIVAGDRDPLVKPISKGATELQEHHYPTIYIEIPDLGRQYLTSDTMANMIRWLDALDRM